MMNAMTTIRVSAELLNVRRSRPTHGCAIAHGNHHGGEACRVGIA